MKRKLLFAMLCIVGALGLRAQTWTGSEVAAGTYYLYNVGADAFLSYGAAWGTRAIKDDVGIPVTLEATGSAYNIRTNVTGTSGNVYLGADFYIDQAACAFTFEPVAGLENTYTMSYGSGSSLRYRMIVTGSTTFDQVSSIAAGGTWTLESLYWKLVSKEERDAKFAAGNAQDITYKYIENPNTAWYTGCYSTNNPWQGTALGGFNGRDAGSSYRDRNTEHYNKIYDTYITATDVPAGKYRFSMSGFYRDGTGATAIQNYKNGTSTLNAKIYANSNTTNIQSIGVGMRTAAAWSGAKESTATVDGVTYYVPNGQDVVTFYTNAGFYPMQDVETVVTDGTLRFGMKKESTIANDWTIFDKFRLKYVDPFIRAQAIALPDGGDMAAGQWYYYDIAVEGEYTIAATTLGDIKYTNNGDTFVSEEGSISGAFTATQELSVARYYVKSTTANNLTFTPNLLSYEVGAPTAQTFSEGNTVVSVSTFTVTYGNAATNDEATAFRILNASAKATLTKGGTPVAEGTLTADNATHTLTATFPTTVLDLGVQDYTISIPASVVGYNDEAKNAAITVNIKSPLIAEGTYYCRNTADGRYLTRGGNYGTEATVDLLGVAFDLQSQTDGGYKFKNIEHSLSVNEERFLNGTDGFYTDQTGGTSYTLQPTTGGYYIKVGGKYLNYTHYANETRIYDYLSVTDDEASAVIWQLESKAEYASSLTAAKNTEISAIATAAGISASTTAELESIINDADTYMPVVKTSAIGNPTMAAEDGSHWTAVNTCEQLNLATNSGHTECAEIWNTAGAFQQTIAGLPEGIYRVTVNATWRPGDMAAGQRVGDNANTTAWLYANTSAQQHETQLVPWYTVDQTINGRSTFVAKVNEDNNNYLNVVYVYVAEGEDLTIGVKAPNYCNVPWCPIYNWTLTQYTDQMDADLVTALIASIPTDAMAKADKDAIALAKANLEEDATIRNYNALVAAIEAAATSITQYQTYNYYLSAIKANNATAAASVETKYNAGTIESTTAMVSEFRTNLLATLATDEVTDYTAVIINPGFETGPFLTSGTVTGWTVATDGREAFASNNNSGRTFTPGYTGSSLFNTWQSSGAAANSYFLRQDFGILPAGQYRMTGYLASAANNQYTVNVGSGSANVTTSASTVGTPFSVIFTSDGTSATAFDISTDKWFKADDFHLTLIGDGTNALPALAAAINTPYSKLGFENGEYAPYNNVERIKRLMAITEEVGAAGTVGSYEIAEYVDEVEDMTWTTNVGEVNAIGGGDLQTYTAKGAEGNSTGYDLALGWNNAGYNTRIQGISEGASNAGLSGTTNSRALLVKYGTSYGESTGYTLPLKANTVYRFSFGYGLWNEGGLITKGLTATTPNGNTINMTPAKVSKNEGSKEACGHVNPEAWYTFEAFFRTAEAGDYVLNIVNTDAGNQRQMAFYDFMLKKAVAEDLTIAENADYTPAVKYADVTLKRTIKADTWNSIVLPFDVTNAELTTAFGGDVEVAEFSEDSDDPTKARIDFTTMGEPSITAHTPVLLKTSTAGTSYTFTDRIIPATTEAKVEGTNFDFVGNYEATITLDAKDYYLSANNLYKSKGTATLKGTRAYFLNKNKDIDPEVKLFFDDDLETAISLIESEARTSGNEAIYNMAGQRVNKAVKGVYIINGRKAIVK